MSEPHGYMIEGGFDFYNELYSSLDAPTPTPSSADEEEIKQCLITGDPLGEHSVTLECNHSFNYVPLFNDLYNNKKKFNAMDSYILKCGEIRCPYCRNVQTRLLPYYEGLGIKKVHGVNFFDELQVIKQTNHCNEYQLGKCCHKYNNDKLFCSNKYVVLVPNMNKSFCYSHKSLAIKNYMKEQKEKAIKQKADQKKALKDAKIAATLAAKAEKLAAKAEKQLNIVINTAVCCEILKSGAKKGTQCGAKISKEGMCLRHFNLVNKPVIAVTAVVVESVPV